MKTLQLGAKGQEGTKMPASLPRIRMDALDANRVATQVWKLLSDADLPKNTFRLRGLGKKARRKAAKLAGKSEFPVPLTDVIASNASHIAALEEKIRTTGPIERKRLGQLLGVYSDTFDYALRLADQFKGDCGPHETFVIRYKAAERKFRKEMETPGFLKLVEKYGLPMLGGLSFGEVADHFKATDLLAGVLRMAFHRMDLETAKWIARGISVFAAGVALVLLRAGADKVVKKVEGVRGRVLTHEAVEKLGAIGRQMHEVKKAIADLVVLEYQRLATKKSIRTGAAPQSEELIARRMVQVVLNVRAKHGFELLLPKEVEDAHWEILHPQPINWPKVFALCMLERVKDMFRGKEPAEALGHGHISFEPSGKRAGQVQQPQYLAWDVDAMGA